MTSRVGFAPAARVCAAAAGLATAVSAPWLVTRGPIRCRFMPGLSGRGRSDSVALTFDDGPDPASTPRVLAALDRLGWRATFFMLGAMADRHPAVAAEVAAAGHEVAVHGYRHRSHLHRTPRDVRDDVARATDVVAAVTERIPVWFRPPYGTIGWGTVDAARQAGLRVVLWTAWGRDWRPAATSHDVVRTVARGLGPGATVLLHDSDCTSAPGSWRTTVAALDGLAELFDGRGLQPGPLVGHGLQPGPLAGDGLQPGPLSGDRPQPGPLARRGLPARRPEAEPRRGSVHRSTPG